MDFAKRDKFRKKISEGNHQVLATICISSFVGLFLATGMILSGRTDIMGLVGVVVGLISFAGWTYGIVQLKISGLIKIVDENLRVKTGGEWGLEEIPLEEEG